MAANFFDQFDKPRVGTVPGGIIIKDADPKRPFEADQAAATLSKTQIEAKLAARTAADEARQKKASADKAEAEAHTAQANDPTNPNVVVPNSNLHGEAYLKTVQPSMSSIVRSVLRGNMTVPGFAYKDPYWKQVLQHAVNADPDFNAADYNTRAKTRQNFADGKMGLNITALNTALGHAGQLQQDVGDLGNYGGVIGGMIVNPIRNWFRSASDPAITNFQNDARAYGDEKTAVFTNGGGGQGEREDASKSIPINGTPDQQIGVLTHDAMLFKSRLDSLQDQFKRGMGRTADLTDLLNPHARDVYQSLLGQTGPVGVIGGVPGAGSTPGAPPVNPSGGGSDGGPGIGGGRGGSPPSGGNLATTIATGADRQVLLPHVNSVINTMVRAGATADDIGKAIAPYGFPTPSEDEVRASQAYLRAHPNYTGSFGGYTKTVPNTTLQRIAGSGVGAAAAGAAEGATGGFLPQLAGGVSYLEGNGYGAGRDQFKVSEAMMQDAHPGPSLAGNIIGGILPMGGLEAGAARVGFGKFAAPAAEAAYGGVSGYNKDGAAGAVTGAIAAPVAGVLGRRVIAPVIRPVTTAIGGFISNAADRAGISLPGSSVIPKPSPAARTVLSAAQKAGIPDIQQSLSEAAQLGVPMSLADTSPQLRSLAGAAVRRSPTAAGIAEDALIPRARGQIDRLSSAVSRDLGPVSNIPQTSADLITQARTAAAPLYDKAYASPPIGSPELDSLVQTPFGQTALQRARTIAANERRDPAALGFALSDDGTVKLNPVATDQYGQLAAVRSARDDLQQQLDSAQRKYSGGAAGDPAQIDGLRGHLADANQKLEDAHLALSASPTAGVAQTSSQYTPQTLDYVKRGMDDVLEQQRNPITGKLQLDEAGRAQNDVRSSLLTELDKLNPAYGQARAAYAGPAASRDALARGQDAFSLSPDELGMQVSAQSPEHLSQMQLGYRSEMMNRANGVRDGSNPFEITLGNPNARARISTLYPDNPGTDNLFRTRDLEGQLARTNNDVLGGSHTAGRQIADRAFTGSPLPALAVDAGLMAAGHVPVATISRAIGSSSLKDLMTLGTGSRAVAKADDMAPILLNPDPTQSAGVLSGLASNSATYRDYINNLLSRRFSGAASAAVPVAALQAQP